MTSRRRRSRIAARRKQAAGAAVSAPTPAAAPLVPASSPTGVTWKRVVAVEPAEVARSAFCAARGLPEDATDAQTDPVLAVASGAWRAMTDHARSAPVEVGGLLVGEVFRDETGRLLVDAAVAIPALGAVQEAAYFRLTEAAWEHISRERAALHPDLLTVGWYHTHPGLGVFFSGTDRASQRAFFNRPWNIGLVIDPQRDEIALFRGEESERLSPAHLVVYAGEGIAPAVREGMADGAVRERERGDDGFDGRGHDWLVYGVGEPDSRRWSGRAPAVPPTVSAPALSPALSPDQSLTSSPATVAPAPSRMAGTNPSPAHSGGVHVAAAPLAPPVQQPEGMQPAPLAVPWAPLAALAGAVLSFALAARSGMRSRRGRR